MSEVAVRKRQAANKEFLRIGARMRKEDDELANARTHRQNRTGLAAVIEETARLL